MFRIRYASRIVHSDNGPEVVSGTIVTAARIKETFSRYEGLEDAVRQAVNDLYFGKIVLGIEDEDSGQVIVSVTELTALLEKAKQDIAQMEEEGYGSKRARQSVMRGVVH